MEIDSIAESYSSMAIASPQEIHPIPKKIWMLWQQGWDKAPDLVKACAESWRRTNPEWEVRLLNEADLSETIRGYDQIRSTLPRQARADIARTLLLNQHGGVWADSTLYCVRPLDEWLPAVTRSGFFMFAEPRPYRSLDNWFIVGSKGNYMLAAMVEIFSAYLYRFEKPHRYFWMIYLTEHLAATDPIAREILQDMGKLSALGPLIVANHAFSRNPPASVLRFVEEPLVPMHKLNHRWSASDLSGTLLGRLTGLQAIRGSQPT
ncbi:MAG: hypothetical protein Devi2KO_31820 [Devosia indica]